MNVEAAMKNFLMNLTFDHKNNILTWHLDSAVDTDATGLMFAWYPSCTEEAPVCFSLHSIPV